MLLPQPLGHYEQYGSVIVYRVRRGDFVNVVAHCDDDTWTEESWTRECDRVEAVTRYAGWHESLLRLFAASERHYKWALFERDPLPSLDALARDGEAVGIPRKP